MYGAAALVVRRRWGGRGLAVLWLAVVALLAAWIQLRVIPSFGAEPESTGHALRAPTLLIVPWVLGFAAVTVLLHRRVQRGATRFTGMLAVQSGALFVAGGLVFFLVLMALDFVPLVVG